MRRCELHLETTLGLGTDQLFIICRNSLQKRQHLLFPAFFSSVRSPNPRQEVSLRVTNQRVYAAPLRRRPSAINTLRPPRHLSRILLPEPLQDWRPGVAAPTRAFTPPQAPAVGHPRPCVPHGNTRAYRTMRNFRVGHDRKAGRHQRRDCFCRQLEERPGREERRRGMGDRSSLLPHLFNL